MKSRGVRVIAGLRAVAGLPSRPAPTCGPTKDMVREAVFSALDARAARSPARHVLDLYAGTGALGIEALSRGAAARCSSSAIARARRRDRRRTSTHARLRRRGRGSCAPTSIDFLAAPPRRREAPFDLVLADPPYDAADRDVAEVVAHARGARAGSHRTQRSCVERPAGAAVEPARRRSEPSGSGHSAIRSSSSSKRV